MALLALLLGLLIAYPQIRDTVRYYPKSVRAKTGYAEKVEAGSLSPFRILLGLATPRVHDKTAGVYYPEATCYLGVIGLLFALSYQGWLWWVVATTFLLTMGKRTPIWKVIHPLCLRIPARFIYFLGVTLSIMSVHSLSTVYSQPIHMVSSHTLLPLELLNEKPTTVLMLLTILQAWDLLQNSSLVPMHPFTQMWQRPSQAYESPVTSYLKSCHLLQESTHRVIGLPYPNSTGQVQHIRTQGYNGGAAPTELTHILGGSQTYFWQDSRMLDWYGVKWAYTYRRLEPPKWKQTEVPHLYENTQVYNTPHEL